MAQIRSPIPILGFAAYSGTGKTTLLTSIIPLLKQKKIRLAILKHAHHDFDIDQPGKDSYKLRKAGADVMLIASRKRWAMMVENDPPDTEPSLQTLIDRVDTETLDLILVEGFKHENFPKIELYRAEYNKDFLYPDDPSIIAIATDTQLSLKNESRVLEQLDINNPSHIATYICDNFLNS